MQSQQNDQTMHFSTMVLQNNVNAFLKMFYSCVNEISRLLSPAYRQHYFSFYAMKGTFNPFPMNFIV